MPDRSDMFLQVMAAIGVVGVLAFVVYLVSHYLRRSQTAVAEGAPDALDTSGPRWFEVLLALLLLAVVTAVLLWQFAGGALSAAGDWRGDDRALVFFLVMLAVAVIGAIAFLVFFVAQAADRRRRQRLRPAAAADDAAPAAAAPVLETPSGLRLLGLLLFAVGFLLLNWIYVPGPLQYALMLYLIYPVGLATVLVLLIDKATRAWSSKGAAESAREWFFCDAMALFLVLGFLNLLQAAKADAYTALFWDFLFVVLTFLAFWLVDRQATRFRFLVGFGYFILLPILLLIWRTIQEVPVPEALSWWSTIWPFLLLAIVAFILEVATLLIPGSDERQGVPALKDVVFYVLYAILLIVALPEAA